MASNGRKREQKEVIDANMEYLPSKRYCNKFIVHDGLDMELRSSKNYIKSNKKEEKLKILKDSVFSNHMIMDKIFQKFSTRELVRVRRTCKAWNNYLVPEIRKASPELSFSLLPLVTIEPSGRMYRKELGRQKLMDFVRTMEGSQGIPFTKFAINNISYKDKCFLDFFEIMGHVITELELKFFSNRLPAEQFRRIIFKMPCLHSLTFHQGSIGEDTPTCFTRLRSNEECTILPNLKTLTLGATPNGESAEFLLRDIFKAAINLEHIEVQPFDARFNTFRLLQAIADGVNLDKFKLLTFPIKAGLTNQELALLIAMSENGVEGKRLTLTQWRTNYLATGEVKKDGGEQLNLFLSLQANYLLKLKAWLPWDGTYHGPNIEIHLPVMKSLRSLHFGMYDSPNIDFEFDSFRTTFPRLESLTYKHLNVNQTFLEQKWDRIMRHSLPHYGVTKLKVHHVDNNMDRLLRLIALFPSLLNLKLQIETWSCLPIIWSGWPKLQTVEIELVSHWDTSLSMDEYITGIPNSKHDFLWELDTFHSFDRKTLEQTKTAPGVTDLKDLRVLKLGHMLPICNQNITDISGYYGFGLLEKLRELKIRGGTDISIPCFEAICTAMGPQAKVDL